MSILRHKDVPDHESYGLVQLSRCEGQVDLFGSPIRAHSFIALKISKGHLYHGLGSDRETDDHLITEVYMSEMQFAEAITTMNRGVGTPCTLRYVIEGDRLKELEFPPRQTSEASRTREEFRKEVEERMATMKSVKRRIDTLMAEGSLAKSRRMEIGSEIDQLMNLFTDSAPFFMERFEENAEKVVATAKAEITAHADLTARNTGIAAIKAGDVPLLDS